MNGSAFKKLIKELRELPNYGHENKINCGNIYNHPVMSTESLKTAGGSSSSIASGSVYQIEKDENSDENSHSLQKLKTANQINSSSINERDKIGFKVSFDPDNIKEIQIHIDGPTSSPYEGGGFIMKLVLDDDYPISPPKGYFLTKIFHPNVGPTGEICVDTLKKEWTPDTTIMKVILTIKCLMLIPNPESALNEEAGKLFMEDYNDFVKHAKLMTDIHAFKAIASNPARLGQSAKKREATENPVSPTRTTTNQAIKKKSGLRRL